MDITTKSSNETNMSKKHKTKRMKKKKLKQQIIEDLDHHCMDIECNNA